MIVTAAQRGDSHRGPAPGARADHASDGFRNAGTTTAETALEAGRRVASSRDAAAHGGSSASGYAPTDRRP